MLERVRVWAEYSGMKSNRPSRRTILAAAAASVAGICVASSSALGLQEEGLKEAKERSELPPWDGPIIDVHQHTNYLKRPDEALLRHQQRMGVTQTILLPSGSDVNSPATHQGKANGLYAGAGGVETVAPIAAAHPGAYYFFANEVPDLPDARKTLETWLQRGAIGIGEQKFNLACDSPEMEMVYALAQEYQVPVLMHFQYEMFNTGYERFGKVLEKWPKVNFIGHAQMFWANIDADSENVKQSYPKGPVKRGGLTDKYLSDYPNLYGDLSAGSGLNSLIRDEDHARGFIERHQERLLFGSDCPDHLGHWPTCTGASIIAAIRRLSGDEAVARKVLYANAKALLKV
jgi:predicted TIM-barrel fold metal-dependent hydrolase